jgi:hypothetical protein
MKRSIITCLLFVGSMSQPFAQISFTGVVTVFDVQNISPDYSVISAMDSRGMTIQFEVKSLPVKTNGQLVKKTAALNIPLGTAITVDLNSGTASVSTSPTIKYKLIKPGFSECCSISRIDKLTNTFSYLMTAKPDTANGITCFTMTGLVGMYPGGEIGQAVYEKYFNNTRYAVLKYLHGASTSNDFVIYCYNFRYMTNENYYDLKKDEEQVDPTPAVIITTDSLSNSQNASISIQVPADAECKIKVYQTPSSVLLFNSDTQRVFSVAPGSYNVAVSGIYLHGFTVEKAQNARITAGMVDVKSASEWRLLPISENVVYASTVSKKVVFPIGSYRLWLDNAMHLPKIKDGQTLHYGDDPQPAVDTVNTDPHPWEIINDPDVKGIGGEISLQVPKEINFHTHLEFFQSGDHIKRAGSWFGNTTAKFLPGLYDILVDGKYTIKNVPVEQGKKTRLKMGVLNVHRYGSFELENSSHQKFSYAPPFSIILPEGTYHLTGRKDFKIDIKDAILTEL